MNGPTWKNFNVRPKSQANLDLFTHLYNVLGENLISLYQEFDRSYDDLSGVYRDEGAVKIRRNNRERIGGDEDKRTDN